MASLRSLSRSVAVAACVGVLGCSGDSPVAPEPPEDQPPIEKSGDVTVVVSSAPAQAEPDSTIAVEFRVLGPDSDPVSDTVVVLAVVAGGGSISSRSAISDSLGAVAVDWTLGRDGESQGLRASVGDQSAVARVKAIPIVVSMSVEASATELSALGDSVTLSATVRDRYGVVVEPREPLRLEVVSEQRALEPLAVLTASNGLVLRATGPGSSEIRVSHGAVKSNTVGVAVEPDTAIVSSLSAPDRVVGGSQVTLHGYRLDLLGAGSITVDGVVADFTPVDQTAVTFEAPARSLGVCNGASGAAVQVAGALVLTSPLLIRYQRDGEIALDVGEAVRLGSAMDGCLLLPPDPGSEYALFYVDPRAIYQSETEPEDEGFVFQSLNLEISDRSGAASAPVFLSGTDPTAEAAGRKAEMRQRATPPSAGTAPVPDDYIGFRQTPWQVGDRASIWLDLEYHRGTIVRIYDQYALLVLDRDSLLNIPQRLSEIDASMEFVVRHAASVFEPALSPNFPATTEGSGQLIMFVSRWEGAPAFWTGESLAFAPPGIGDLSQPVYLHWATIVHELAHAWQERHYRDVCIQEGLCGGGSRGAWGYEGSAEFLTEEVGRALTGRPLQANVDPFQYVENSCCLLIYYGTNSYSFGRGYGSSSWFFRDALIRAVKEGHPYASALGELAKGANEGWYGWFAFGPKHEGLVPRMSRLLGRSWDPVEALLTGGLSLAMDDLTPSPTYQNFGFRNVWQIYEPMAVLRAGQGTALSIDTRSWTFGYIRIEDDGLGGSYHFGASADGVEWIVGRVH